MPSKTPAQHKLMEIAAHTQGGYGGVPQSVGKDFALADIGKKFGPPLKTPKAKKRKGR